MVASKCKAICVVAYLLVGGVSGAGIAWWLSNGDGFSEDAMMLWITLPSISALGSAIGSVTTNVPAIASSASANNTQLFMRGALAALVAVVLSSIVLGGVETARTAGPGITGWIGMSGLILFWAALMFGLPSVILGGLTAFVVRKSCTEKLPPV